MGFYPPRTLAEEAKRLEIKILPPSVNHSEADYTVEGGRIRCGLRFMRGMTGPALQSILQARDTDGAFGDLPEFCLRTKVPYPVVRHLILAGAFEFTGLIIPELMRQFRDLKRLKLAALDPCLAEPEFSELTELSAYQRLEWDLHLLGLSTGMNPFFPWVDDVQKAGAVPSAELLEHPDGHTVQVAGIVVARARPPTRSGKTAIFLCLEDHTGLVDIAVFEQAYQRYGHIIYSAPALMAEGKLTRQGVADTSITVHRLWPLNGGHCAA